MTDSEPFDVNWQDSLQTALSNGSWDADVNWDEEETTEVSMDLLDNMDFVVDIVYFAARQLKSKSLKAEHKQLLDTYEPELKNRSQGRFHDANVDTHARIRDEDTDKRDEKYYPNDRLHEIDDKKASWEETLKAPFPNHLVGNRRARGNRKIRRGTGKNGLFKYSEINELLEDSITPLIDARYEKEIDKLTKKNIRESKKRLKEEGKELEQNMIDYITKKVKKVMDIQKNRNLYATAYGAFQSSIPGMGSVGKGKWFAGGLSPLGYNPKDSKQMTYVMRRVSGLGKKYFTEWGKQDPAQVLQEQYNTLKELKEKATLENNEKRLKTVLSNMKNIEEKANEQNIVLKSVSMWELILKNVQYEGTCKKCKTFKRKGDRCELRLPAHGVVSFGTHCPMKIKDDRFTKDLGAITTISPSTAPLFNNKANRKKEEDE